MSGIGFIGMHCCACKVYYEAGAHRKCAAPVTYLKNLSDFERVQLAAIVARIPDAPRPLVISEVDFIRLVNPSITAPTHGRRGRKPDSAKHAQRAMERQHDLARNREVAAAKREAEARQAALLAEKTKTATSVAPPVEPEAFAAPSPPVPEREERPPGYLMRPSQIAKLYARAGYYGPVRSRAVA